MEENKKEYKYDVFISYSRKDTKTADKICNAFDKAGITYFIDRQGIGGGMEFPVVLSKAIRESTVFLFLASKNSYSSKFTQSEIVYAFNKKEQKQDIIPYIIDGSDLPEELAFTFSAINWLNINQHPINTVLIKDIQERLVKTPPKPALNSEPRFRFTGKMLAQIIFCLSAAYFLFIVISKIASASYLTVFFGWSLLLLFILLLFLLVGFLRPKSVDLDSRKDVAKYYLTSCFFFFLAVWFTTTEGEVSHENTPQNVIESTIASDSTEVSGESPNNR